MTTIPTGATPHIVGKFRAGEQVCGWYWIRVTTPPDTIALPPFMCEAITLPSIGCEDAALAPVACAEETLAPSTEQDMTLVPSAEV